MMLTLLCTLRAPVWGQAKPGASPDTAAWIGEVFRQRAHTRIVDLILPGSHDAGSFAITEKSKTAPGLREAVSCHRPLGNATSTVTASA